MRRLRAAALTLLLAATTLTGCGEESAGSVVVVIGPWVDDAKKPGEEADVFAQLLDAYETTLDGVDIQYQGTRAIGQVVQGKIKDGTLPDVAIMPNVGELAGYATEELARPVTSLVAGSRPPAAGPVVVDHRALWRGDQAYAVAIKTDLKSLLIFAPDHIGPPPATLEQMAAIPPGSWCLGLSEPSAPGWPGTDWVEDLLLHRAGRDNYQAWASGDLKWTSDAVRAAFREFRENYVAGPATLLASPTEAASDLVNGHRCTAMHQSSFYAQGGSVPYQMPRSEPGVEVSGDFAARFTANPAAETLLKDLTDPGSALARDWVARSRGMVFPLTPQPELYTGDRRRVANLFTAGARCMDASDAMPPAMASAFQNAILEYVADPAPAKLTEVLGRLQKVQAAVSKDEKLEVYCSTGAA